MSMNGTHSLEVRRNEEEMTDETMGRKKSGEGS